MGLAPDFKFTQQDLTELNSDGNRERGRYGEDESKPPEEKKIPPRGAPVFKGWEKEYLPDEDEEDKPKPIPNEDENPSW